MPSYELNFIIRRMAKADMIATVKRVGETVLENQGILRKIEFLGHKPFPFSMSNYRKAPGSKRLTQGSYFIYHCDMGPQTSAQLVKDFRLDPDFVKIRFLRKEENIPKDYVCSLDEEMRPPSFRKSVQKLIEEGRKIKPKSDMGTKEM